MNDDSLEPLIARVRGIILNLFDVSEAEANEHATGLALLATGWGGDNAYGLDWIYRVKKELGERLKWKSQAERGRFEAERKASIDSYEAYIGDKNAMDFEGRRQGLK